MLRPFHFFIISCCGQRSRRVVTVSRKSFWADIGGPGLRTPEVPVVGGQRSPGGRLGEGGHPLAGGGFGEAVAVAGGDADVGVVHEPVDGRGGEGLVDELVEAAGVQVDETASLRRSSAASTRR